MSFVLKVLDSGLESLNLSGSTYGVMEATLVGVGEPGILAAYAQGAESGSSLTQRRHENRVIEFALKIETTAATAVDDVETARNDLANVIDKARRYALRDSASLGVRDTRGEILLKYKKSGATHPIYARVLDGELRDDPSEHSALSALKGSGASSKVVYAYIPVRLVLEPYWRPERDVYLRNVLINGGFEAGVSAGVPYGWGAASDAGITASYGQSESFVEAGRYSHRHEITGSTATGETYISQTFNLADVGLVVGKTVSISVRVYIYSLSGTAVAGLVYSDGVDAFDSTSTVGEWVTLRITKDIRSGATSITVKLRLVAQTIGDTITAFFDNAQVQPYLDNLLLTGGFEADADSDGIADHWTVSTSGTATAGNSISATAKYGSSSQSLARTGGDGNVGLVQDVAVSTHDLKAGDVVTAAAWCRLTSVSGSASARLRVQFLDASSRAISQAVSSDLTATDVWTYLSASGTIPQGCTTIRVTGLLPEVGTTANIFSLWDWAVLKPGHHDGSGGRLFPYTSEWTDSGRLILDHNNTAGKQMTMSHSGFRGNVPSPARLIFGLGHTAPATVLTGYKRGDVKWSQYDTSSATAVASLTAGATSGMIGGSSRRWTPGNTTETSLMTWTITDHPPGRYLVALGVNVSATGRFKFRAGARAYSGADTNAGVWTPDLVKAPPWENSGVRQVWPIGVLELPVVNRMGQYINDFILELLGRCTDTSGGPTVDMDFLYLLPVDGYAEVQPSPNANAVTPGVGTVNVGILELDSIRDFLPVYARGTDDGTATLYELDGIQDVGQMRGQRFHVGAEGKFIVVHLCNTGFDPSYQVNLGLFYRPRWTTPVSE